MIVGMLGTKDFEGYLRNFSGLALRLYAVPVPNADKSLSPGQIADSANKLGIPAENANNVEAALAAIKALSLSAPRILIGGSLYLAGDVLARNNTPPA